ncbi:MAG: RluA family pseudouridine synthase [Lachnospiraceae bacterium]|jgi:23S rRNA pseudouridine1911/1915/1917 synthase
MIRTLTYDIPREYSGHKISEYLRGRGYSEQNLKILRHTPESIFLNGEEVFMNARFSGNDDHLKVVIRDRAGSENIPPVEADLNIVYEDEDIIVINKSGGMPVHPSINNYENTLANALAYYYEKRGEDFVFRCLNRLDKDTTGLTVIAKHMLSSSILYEEMQQKKVKRTYYAVVSQTGKNGEMLPDHGCITAPIGRAEDGIISRCVDFENGQDAITHFSVEKRKKEYALLKLNLETGRTHQIRVHMSWLGFPLIGDYMYGEESGAIKRQALHAGRLEMIHPITGEKLLFEAELPEDMASLLM